MYRVVIVTDRDTADGFKLSGVAVRVVETLDDANRVIGSLLDDEQCGIIAVAEKYMPAIDERLQRKIDTIYRPIVVAVPVKETLGEGAEAATGLARLIRRAIGFDITLKRG